MNKDIKDIIQSFDLMLGDNKSVVNEVALISPVDQTKVNSGFGPRWGTTHNGVDLAANATEVKSPADGVVEVGAIKNDDCGGTIIINHAGGFRTGFCHMQKIMVNPGDNVKQGDVIGISGGGKGDIGHGRSDGRHLHFTLRKDGKLVNPMDYIDKNNVIMTGEVPKSSSTSDNNNDTTSGTTTTIKPDENDIETKFLRGIATQLGIKEERFYSNLGNKISISFGKATIPSDSNTKIKSPVNGVINNFHSQSSCNNQITIEHNFEGHSYYLNFCGITHPEVRDGEKVFKGTVLGKTSSDVVVTLYNSGWERVDLEKMLKKEIDQTSPLPMKKVEDEKDKKDKDKDDKKEKSYYDPYAIWFFNKVKEKMPSISKGGEPKIKNFYNKYSLSGKKVDENIERIKKLL
jgi:murein DD-endopeptidase MepM/ murein hydrolase activator NlpD